MKNQDLEKLIANLPSLHLWANVRQNGGFGPLEAQELYENVLHEFTNEASIIETGAGNSSIIFLTLSPKKLISITNDNCSDLENGIRRFATEYGLNTSVYQYINNRSELALPKLAETNQYFDLCLIDGGHGWPTVFVDFCYLNCMLKKGGVLILDDVQLNSVQPLFELLKQQPGWQFFYLFKNQKTSFFRKLTNDKFLPDFYSQPYFSNIKTTVKNESLKYD